MKAVRLLNVVLWTDYALIGYAIVLAWTTQTRATANAKEVLWGILAGFVLLVLVPWMWTRRQTHGGRQAWRQLGWSWFPEWVAVGAACGLLLFGATLPLHGPEGHLPQAALLLFGVAAAVMEEVFFRGHLRQRIGAWQILPFAALHGNTGATLLVPLVAGLLFTWLARHGLGASIAAHAAFNLAAAS